MTFALSQKVYSCWTCDHFLPKDPENTVEGWCRKYAPRGRDLYGPCAACGGDILTTKGDVLTHDGSTKVRLDVGTDGQVLTANSVATDGISWETPIGGSSPLTTKGDIYTRDTADQRIGVGSDGQILAADSAEATGLKWIDPSSGGAPYPYIADASNESEQSTASGTFIQALTVNFTAEVSVRYRIDWYFEIFAPADEDVEAQVDVNNSNQVCLVKFKANTYADSWGQANGGFYITTALSGSTDVDIDFLNSYGAGTKKIRRCRLLITRVDEAPAMMAALETAAEEPGFVGSINPDDITIDESFAKWCLIKVGPNEWCGEYKPASSRVVPEIPPFTYPEPTP